MRTQDRHADPCPSCRFRPTKRVDSWPSLWRVFERFCRVESQYRFCDDHESLPHRERRLSSYGQTHALLRGQWIRPRMFCRRRVGQPNTARGLLVSWLAAAPQETLKSALSPLQGHNGLGQGWSALQSSCVWHDCAYSTAYQPSSRYRCAKLTPRLTLATSTLIWPAQHAPFPALLWAFSRLRFFSRVGRAQSLLRHCRPALFESLLSVHSNNTRAGSSPFAFSRAREFSARFERDQSRIPSNPWDVRIARWDLPLPAHLAFAPNSGSCGQQWCRRADLGRQYPTQWQSPLPVFFCLNWHTAQTERRLHG